MVSLSIFDLAGRHARWLMSRQAAVADNVAHASAPGYRAVDVKPFEQMVERPDVALSLTDARHMSSGSVGVGGSVGRRVLNSNMPTHSGNTVSLDQQLMIANEVRQAYSLNAGIVRSMHRMIMTAVKG